jgi:2-polyprenyl-6-hydroxyphenyl methylase/3-demethylubiquinone-9 3-methyltransferase
MEASANVDRGEIAHFDALASRWWDPEGEFRTLHEINPLRLDWIRRHAGLEGRRILDVGCGGGILAEAMAAAGATVTGIDMAPAALSVAKLHRDGAGLEIEYVEKTAEELALERAGEFDVVTCMELLEHVPRPSSVVEACARLARPGGHVFFATINRHPKAFVYAIVGAEYLLRLLPQGTHEYARFIRPSELAAWARKAGLALEHETGMHYNPLTREYWLGPGVEVNYLMHFVRPESG